MDGTSLCGQLSETPFPCILAEIWRKGLTGTLRVNHSSGNKSFTFDKGSLAIGRSSLSEKSFLKSLLTSGVLDLITLDKCEEYAQQHEVSLIRALHEIPLLQPDRVWTLLKSYVKDEILLLFGPGGGKYEFEGCRELSEPLLIEDIPLPGLILDGIRTLEDPASIAPHLPPETESLQKISRDSGKSFSLIPHEVYLLNLLDKEKTVSEIIALSELGPRETQRTLFALICLGLAGKKKAQGKTGKTSSELTLSDMDRLFKIFNDRCSSIFKYISKEIGPVASSVIEKALQDIKDRLDPAFHELILQADGRIELKSSVKMNMSFAAEDTRESLLKSMDEILVAEVLAVKRTLGPEHESALVKNLEKIGDLS